MSVNPTINANAAVLPIAGAIRKASQVTGTNFGYLLATAKVESNFDPGAKASTSSASGLYQFIDQTWLATMKDAGPGLGYGQYADAIAKTSSGRYEVSDPAMRAKIMNLRHDPTANAVMAGAFTNKNAELLAGRLGRQPSEGELYIAHFLGASGAGKLITAADSSQGNAAALYPNAARANRSIFYDRQGQARSAAEVVATLTGRYDVARAGSAMPVMATIDRVASPKVAVPDTAGITQAFAANSFAPPRPADSEPVFHALFHTAERSEALAPKVNQLWGSHPAATPARTATLSTEAVAPATASGNMLDLFQDMPSDVRGLFGGTT